MPVVERLDVVPDPGAVASVVAQPHRLATMSRFTLDLAENDQHPPAIGDLMTTQRNVYLVTGVREIDSRVWCNRWAIDLQRLGPRRDLLTIRRAHPDGEIRRTSRYRKGEGPREFFGRQQ